MGNDTSQSVAEHKKKDAHQAGFAENISSGG